MARILLLLGCLISMPATAQSTEPARYQIDDEKSWVRIQVFRGGLLAGFGHNHVVSVHDLSGTIEMADNVSESRLHLEFPVTSLTVDEPEDREAEGERFRRKISDKSIAETRENMLGDKLLQGDIFPIIVLAGKSISGTLPDLVIRTETTVRDNTAEIDFPAQVNVVDQKIIVSGSMPVSQEDLGLGRFKAALGALRVKDELVVRYRITANRL